MLRRPAPPPPMVTPTAAAVAPLMADADLAQVLGQMRGSCFDKERLRLLRCAVQNLRDAAAEAAKSIGNVAWRHELMVKGGKLSPAQAVLLGGAFAQVGDIVIASGACSCT